MLQMKFYKLAMQSFREKKISKIKTSRIKPGLTVFIFIMLEAVTREE